VVRKLLMAVVAFGTTVPNRPSIITLMAVFWVVAPCSYVVWMLPTFGLLDKRSSAVHHNPVVTLCNLILSELQRECILVSVRRKVCASERNYFCLFTQSLCEVHKFNT
jgi:hypothetical protein